MSCQFKMELDDEVSTKRVLDNHMFVAHREKEQHHQQELCGRKGGQEGGAQKNIIPKTFVRCEELSCQVPREATQTAVEDIPRVQKRV